MPSNPSEAPIRTSMTALRSIVRNSSGPDANRTKAEREMHSAGPNTHQPAQPNLHKTNAASAGDKSPDPLFKHSHPTQAAALPDSFVTPDTCVSAVGHRAV